MHLAKLAGINAAPHTLLRTTAGQLVYVTKRFDRVKGKKNRIRKKDFIFFANNLKLASTIVENIFPKYSALLTQYEEFIKLSFFNNEFKEKYIQLLRDRSEALKLR